MKRVRMLDPKCFKQAPVWAWDEDMEHHIPVMTSGVLPTDQGVLFVEANFLAPTGMEFHGYLVDGSEPYAIGIFIGERKFHFNVNLPGFVPMMVDDMEQAIGRPVGQLFPLHYVSRLKSSDGTPIEGDFDFER